jgi:hypothetical protein
LEDAGHAPTILDFESVPAPAPAPAGGAKAAPKPKSPAAPKASGGNKGGAEMKKETLLGIAHKKEENFADWYTQVRHTRTPHNTNTQCRQKQHVRKGKVTERSTT